MGKINSHSIVETKNLGLNVEIGEYSIIRRNVTLGDNVKIHPFVIIESGVNIGNNVEVFPFAHLGKQPVQSKALSREPDIVDAVYVGDYSSIGPHTTIYLGVKLGEYTLIGDGASIREETEIGKRCIIGRHVTINYAVKIGNDTKIMDHSWLAGNMTIGDHVFISGGVLTSNDNSMGKNTFENGKMKGPIIHDHVVIGIGAKLLPNITINHSAIIGAGAVVTKDVPPNTLVMGIPAREVIRKDD